MAISIQCPSCGSFCDAPEDGAGVESRFPSCGHSFTVSIAVGDTTKPLPTADAAPPTELLNQPLPTEDAAPPTELLNQPLPTEDAALPTELLNQSLPAEDAALPTELLNQSLPTADVALPTELLNQAPSPADRSSADTETYRPQASSTQSLDDEGAKTIGHYVVRRKLGAGAMGHVYLAYDSNLDRDVALKVLPAEFSGDDERLKRFLREGKAAARLQHTNAARVYHAGTADNSAFIAMEFVEGMSLDKLIASHGPLQWKVATAMIEGAATGLRAAHKIGIVHRDVKPANLVWTKDDTIKLVDFGLARSEQTDAQLTQQGTLLGTPAYMAPEQWSGGEANARSDLYSLICTYYHLLTGRPPFHASSLPAMGYQHCHEPFPDPLEYVQDLPNSVCRILARGSAKEPSDRFQSADELKTELQALTGPTGESFKFDSSWNGSAANAECAERSVDAPPTQLVSQTSSMRTQPKQTPPRWPWLTAAVVVPLLLLLLGIVIRLSTRNGTAETTVNDADNPVRVSVEVPRKIEGRRKPELASSTIRASDVPILHFEFEGGAHNSGSLGRSHDGKPFGDGRFVTDAVRGNRVYDPATNGYIIIPPTTFGTHATIAAWVKLDEGAWSIQTILSSYSGAEGGFSLGLNWWYRDNRIVLLESWQQTRKVVQTASVDNVIGYSQWHHVTATLDRTTGLAVFYVDGSPVELNAARFAHDFTDHKPLAIGRYYGGIISTVSGRPASVPFHFTGLIDDLRVYDTTLAEPEIKRLANRDAST